MYVLRGILGMAFLIGVCWLLSNNRRKISWRVVYAGLGLQAVLAIMVLNPWNLIIFEPFAVAFDWIARAFVKVTSFSANGVDFLLGTFGDGKVDNAFFNFAFRVLPTVIFFSAFTSLMYYLGLLQKVVYVFAWIMKRTLKISGAESLAAAGNVFLGQTEAPLLVRPYLDGMTRSETLCLMTGGMATIAGGVMAAYIAFLGGPDKAQQIMFAKHLLTASLMSAPAAIVAAKMIIPETEHFNQEMRVSKDRIGSNVLEAVATGTTDGLKLAVNVGAMLLVFTAFMYFLNYILLKVGTIGDLNMWIAAHTPFKELSFQMLLGYAFAPIAWLMGVPQTDMMMVGQLLGEKTILNEFYAYTTLGNMKISGAISDPRSIVIATYALCGFSNFASIG
ncbi:MAG: Na+ dependent nucleoside transporter, partial [Flavobacteriales bacterium]|nr:Na+ dependent nucleoside transporter [Flavobacteriales bacterium]